MEDNTKLKEDVAQLKTELDKANATITRLLLSGFEFIMIIVGLVTKTILNPVFIAAFAIPVFISIVLTLKSIYTDLKCSSVK